MQRFFKGRTNNHLTFVMPDATDFASPESALSAALKLKIYGKLRSGTGVNFVTSGTGSLTNDIIHVGASALGIYTIALAKADLSDASAAWYDQYICSMSATGAAYQVIVAEGVIDDSALVSMVSDAMSAAQQANSRVLVVQSMASDAASAAAQANSRVLLNQSRISDVYSMLSDLQSDFQSRVPKAVATNSQLSDLHSDLRSVLIVMSGIQSDIYSLLSDANSDLRSLLTVTGVQINASSLSDLRSAIAAGPAATITASDISDIASAVWANTIGARVDSRVLLNQSRISDIQSYLVAMSGMESDIYSLVSNINSMAGASPTASDIASKVWADTAGAAVASRLLLVHSRVSDIQSALSDAHSDLASKIGAVTATVSASDMSDIASRVDVLLASRLSDILSAAQQTNSRVLLTQSMASDAASAAQQANSRVLLVQSLASDVDSALTSRFSDLLSLLGTTGVQLNASSLSDIRSAITAGATGLDASALSDIASAVVAAIGAAGVEIGASSMSDLRSMISDVKSAVTVTQSLASDAHSAAAQTNSRVLVNQSYLSDIRSHISDLQSDFQSRVPKAVATNSQLSDLVSDLKSAMAAGVPLDASTMSDLRSAIDAGGGASLMSDIYSATAQVNSRVLLNQSRISDVYSALVAGVEIGASSLSDIRSAVTANGVLRAGADPTGVVGVTDTLAAKIDWMTAVSRNKVTATAGVQSLRNDADNDTIASAALADDGTTFTRSEWA